MLVYIGKYPDTTWLGKLFFRFRSSRTTIVKINDQDLWSMDHTLALVVTPMLKRLKEIQHGSPNVDDSDVPDGFSTDVHERWAYIINEMIFAFESKTQNWQDEFYEGSDLSFDGSEKGVFKMVNKGKPVDYDGMKQVEKRIANGFLLFGKYYQGLWD